MLLDLDWRNNLGLQLKEGLERHQIPQPNLCRPRIVVMRCYISRSRLDRFIRFSESGELATGFGMLGDF